MYIYIWYIVIDKYLIYEHEYASMNGIDMYEYL